MASSASPTEMLEGFRPLIEEMRRQGVTADSPEAQHLTELVQRLVDLNDKYDPQLEHTPEQLAGRRGPRGPAPVPAELVAEFEAEEVQRRGDVPKTEGMPADP